MNLFLEIAIIIIFALNLVLVSLALTILLVGPKKVDEFIKFIMTFNQINHEDLSIISPAPNLQMTLFMAKVADDTDTRLYGIHCGYWHVLWGIRIYKFKTAEATSNYPYTKSGWSHTADKSREEVQARARKRWALANPWWLVIVLGDREQRNIALAQLRRRIRRIPEEFDPNY